MNEDSFFLADTFKTGDQISNFLAQFGRDLVSWTHVVEPRTEWSLAKHHVVARFTTMYGDIEDGQYVPFN